MEPVQLATLLAGAVLVASMISVEAGISVALIELALGVLLGNVFSLDPRIALSTMFIKPTIWFPVFALASIAAALLLPGIAPWSSAAGTARSSGSFLDRRQLEHDWLAEVSHDPGCRVSFEAVSAADCGDDHAAGALPWRL